MKFLTAAVGIIAALTACGETFSLNSPNDWDSAQKIAASDGVLSLPGNAILKSKKLFPVDPAKKYTLSAIVRNGTKGKSPRLHIGLIPYNAKKQQITAAAMSPALELTGTLAAPVALRDTTVQIKPESSEHWNWKNQWWALVFDAEKDLSDLPNVNFMRIKNLESRDGILHITFMQGAPVARPAGTPVRIHTGGGSYMYPVVNGKALPSEWTEVSGTVTGELSRWWSQNIWPKSTVCAQAVIIVSGTDPECSVDLKALQLIIQ